MTLFVSFGLHLAAVTAALLLPHSGVPAVDVPEKPTEVELVMEERKGDARPITSPQSSSRVPVAARPEHPAVEEPRPVDTPSPATAPVETPPEPPTADAELTFRSDPSPANPVTEASPTPHEPRTPVVRSALQSIPPEPEAPIAPSTPEPTPSQAPAPTITLSGTDSPSDARAWGDQVLPAAPDAVFHNRPPAYPRDAVLTGQHGTVVVVIHVSPAGTAAGVDVVHSSGYVLLDRAAREAVLRWRFLPAVKDGQPVASNMTMGFVFDYE